MRAKEDTSRTARYGLITTALVIAEVVAVLETTMTIQLLNAPDGTDFFTVPISSLTWLVTAYTLVAAISAGIAGRLGDQFGRRKVLAIVLVLGAVGSAVSAVAPSFWILILGRAIQGATGAVLPLSLGLINAVVPKEKAGTSVTIVTSSIIFSGAFGVLFAGVVLSILPWHSIYWITAVAALLAAVLVRTLVPTEPEDTLAERTRLDIVGAALFGLGIGALLFAVTSGSGAGWLSPLVLCFGIGGLVLLAIFVAWELRITSPMLDLDMLRNRKVRTALLISVVLGFGPLGMFTVLSANVTRQASTIGGQSVGVGIGLDPMMFGLTTAAFALVTFLLSGIIGKITTRHGAWMTIIVGCGLTGVGIVMMLVAPTSTLFVLTSIAIVTVGSSCLMSGVPAMILESVIPSAASLATGMAQIARNTFQSVGTAVLGVLLSINAFVIGEAALTSYTGLFAACLAIFAAGVIAAGLSWKVGERRPKPTTNESGHGGVEVARPAEPDHA